MDRGTQIRVQRVIKGLRQIDVEKKTGIPQPRLSYIERGLPPTKAEDRKLKSILDLD